MKYKPKLAIFILLIALLVFVFGFEWMVQTYANSNFRGAAMLHKIGHYVTNRANFIFNGNNVSLFYMVAVVVLLCINVRNIPLKQFCLPYAIAFLLIFIIIGFIDGMLTLRIPMVYYSVAFGVVLFIALREFLAPSYIIFGKLCFRHLADGLHDVCQVVGNGQIGRASCRERV